MQRARLVDLTAMLLIKKKFEAKRNNIQMNNRIANLINQYYRFINNSNTVYYISSYCLFTKQACNFFKQNQ